MKQMQEDIEKARKLNEKNKYIDEQTLLRSGKKI